MYSVHKNEKDQVVSHEQMTINEEVQLMNANSSLISIVQNGKDIYYFKIAKEN